MTVMETRVEINKTGTTILLVEQMVQEALEIARRGYVIQTGHIVHSGTARELLDSEEVRKAYMGMQGPSKCGDRVFCCAFARIAYNM
ncbi:MAG: hypothetical protein ACP5DY_00155 [Thermovirgaceae bacterium]